MVKCPCCYKNKKLIFKYNCKTIKHGICNKCYTIWNKKNGTCPECRALEMGKIYGINRIR